MLARRWIPTRTTGLPPLYAISGQELEKEEAELFQSKDDILQQSQRLTASFLEQKGELEGSRRRAEERVSALEGKLTALQEELDAAGYGGALAVITSHSASGPCLVLGVYV